MGKTPVLRSGPRQTATPETRTSAEIPATTCERYLIKYYRTWDASTVYHSATISSRSLWDICLLPLNWSVRYPFSPATMHQAPLILTAALPFLQPQCHDFNFTVSVEATTQHDFASQPYSAEVLYALAHSEILVSNTYNISARLCIPDTSSTSTPLSDTLQFLIHGATFNKYMWDVTYKPETYSYVQRMAQHGYATLAIDLVGNGNSTFPDGVVEAQTQMYVTTTHQVIKQLRETDIAGGRRWDKIVFVGFSIGAITANSLAAQYPDDADATILHGISWDISWLYPAFLAGLQASAQLIDPEKWGHIAPMYQTQSTREGRKAACFAGSYDEEIVEHDWLTRDFDSLGAAITLTYHLVEAPKYKGPVFLGIGDRKSGRMRFEGGSN